MLQAIAEAGSYINPRGQTTKPFLKKGFDMKINSYLEIDFCKTVAYGSRNGIMTSDEKENVYKLLVIESDNLSDLLNVKSIRSNDLTGVVIKDKGCVRFLGDNIRVDSCSPYYDHAIKKYRLEFVLHGEEVNEPSFVHFYFFDDSESFGEKVNFKTSNLNNGKVYNSVLTSFPTTKVDFSANKEPKIFISANNLDAHVLLTKEIEGSFFEECIYSKASSLTSKTDVIRIPPAWSDHYNISVSFENNDAFNIEHKHILQGTLDRESSRLFFKNGSFLNHVLCPYKSLIAEIKTYNDIILCYQFDYHDATIFASGDIFDECVEFFNFCDRTRVCKLA